MRRLCIAAACSVLAVNVAHAGQPIYESMVECGAIYTTSAELIRSKTNKRDFQNAAAIMKVAAVAEVKASRMPEATSYVEMMHAEKLRLWRSKGPIVAVAQEYRDWTSYCPSLAQSRGIDLQAN